MKKTRLTEARIMGVLRQMKGSVHAPVLCRDGLPLHRGMEPDG